MQMTSQNLLSLLKKTFPSLSFTFSRNGIRIRWFLAVAPASSEFFSFLNYPRL